MSKSNYTLSGFEEVTKTEFQRLINDSLLIPGKIYLIQESTEYTEEDKEKVDIIDKDGDGTKFLSDDGTYKTALPDKGYPARTTLTKNTHYTVAQSDVIEADGAIFDKGYRYRYTFTFTDPVIIRDDKKKITIDLMPFATPAPAPVFEIICRQYNYSLSLEYTATYNNANKICHYSSSTTNFTVFTVEEVPQIVSSSNIEIATKTYRA